MLVKTFLYCLFLIASLSGCASVIKTGSQSVSVKSVPTGADVTTSNGKKGVTPFVFRASRKENCRLTVSKSGYHPMNVILRSGPSITGKIASAGNGLVGGLVGVAIDQATGATLELEPDPVLVRLSPLSSATPSVLLPPGTNLENYSAPSRVIQGGSTDNLPISPTKAQPIRGTDSSGTEYL
jgi:hypothetical protein